MNILRTLILAALLFPSQALAAPPPTVTNANDGIFAAFRTHPLVGIGDAHGLSQEMDFYAALIRDPRFAKEVGNVVLEAGGAAQQDTVDRYVNGKRVPYTKLSKVWTDVVGWVPTVAAIGLVNVYATIRAVNGPLPPNQRIRVWLGEPVIDWSRIKTHAEWEILAKQRDSHAAALIEREILAKGKKALVIYGGAHLGRYPSKSNLRGLVETKYPKAFYIVMPYLGYAQKSCAVQFEKNVRGWIIPSLVSPIRGSSLEDKVLLPGCNTFDRPPNMTDEQVNAVNRDFVGLTGNALLYLGPRDSLNRADSMPDIYLDPDFRDELERRTLIMMGRPFEGFTVDKNPSVDRLWWAN